MYWFPLKFIDVSVIWGRNTWRISLCEADKQYGDTIGNVKLYEQAVEVGRALAKHEKCWFRVHKSGIITIREDYTEQGA